MRIRRTILSASALQTEKVREMAKSRADSIYLDLEDGVPVPLKDQTREETVRVFQTVDFGKKERIVRMNGLDTPYWEKDLKAVLPLRLDALRIPKCEQVEKLLTLDKILSDFERANGIPLGNTKLLIQIETPLGVIRAYELASCCQRIEGMNVGLEDMTGIYGIERRYELSSLDLLYVRQKVINDALAAGIQPLDAHSLYQGNPDFFEKSCQEAKQMGCVGKYIMETGHVDIANQVFSPGEEEIAWAKRVKGEYDAATAKGITDLYLDRYFIDIPVVAKADKILSFAAAIESLIL